MSEKTTNKNKGKTANVLLNILLVAVIVFSIICSFSAYVSKVGSGVPSFFGIRPFAIQSDSMVPFFSKGDLVIDYKVEDPRSLQVGDVIVKIDGKDVLTETQFEEYMIAAEPEQKMSVTLKRLGNDDQYQEVNCRAELGVAE